MKKNIGMIDKSIRVVVALIIAILYFANIITGTLGIVLLALGFVFLLTGLINFCPLYIPFGINTDKKEN